MNIAIIPARLGSSRLPGKVLLDIHGKTLIHRVHDQVQKSKLIDQIWVATDHLSVAQEVESFGGNVMLTGEELISGTDRCAEAMQKLNLPVKFLINIQGDEPFLDPGEIDLMVEHLSTTNAAIVTLITPLRSQEDYHNPNVVKCVRNQLGRALYFSRSPIPFQRDPHFWQERDDGLGFQHVGVYGFRADVLSTLAALEPTSLENSEKLEQLRWLDHGYLIDTLVVPNPHLGIDTLQDLEQARNLMVKKE